MIQKIEDTPCLWNGRINIVKMDIPPKANYRFNVISTKLPMIFFTNLEQMIQKFIELKYTELTKQSLEKVEQRGGITSQTWDKLQSC